MISSNRIIWNPRVRFDFVLYFMMWLGGRGWMAGRVVVRAGMDGWADGCAGGGWMAGRTTLRAADGDLPGRHTLGGLGQR